MPRPQRTRAGRARSQEATAERGHPTERRPKSFVAEDPSRSGCKRECYSANAILKSQLSAVLRDQLLGELKEFNSVDAAAIWARRSLPAKNSLNLADARQLENAFQARLAELELGADNAEPRPSSFGSIRKLTTSLELKGPELTRTSTIERIEKSSAARPEPVESAIEST